MSPLRLSRRWSLKQFQLVLPNSADPGDTLHNMADVDTLHDEEPGNNFELPLLSERGRIYLPIVLRNW